MLFLSSGFLSLPIQKSDKNNKSIGQKKEITVTDGQADGLTLIIENLRFKKFIVD